MFEVIDSDVSLSQRNGKIDKIKAVKNYFNKIFDRHFLVFITNRKQRDLLIFITALKLIAKEGKYNNNILKQYQLTDFFSLSSGNLLINDDVLPIDQNEMVLCLEKETEILKSLFSFYEDFSKQYLNNEIDFAILTKMKKVENLTDELLLNRISNDKKFCDAILSKIKKCKTFNEIIESKTFIEAFEKEIALIANPKFA